MQHLTSNKLYDRIQIVIIIMIIYQSVLLKQIIRYNLNAIMILVQNNHSITQVLRGRKACFGKNMLKFAKNVRPRKVAA